MIKKLFFLFIFLFINFSLIAYEYDLAICAIFRDDAPYLKEWIDFHLKQGVQKFYLYDNFSKDKPAIELKKYIKKGIVEIIPWRKEHNTHDEWIITQCSSYLDFAKKHRHDTKWAIFIDTDEFMFCVDGKKITKFLKDYEYYEQISVPWLIYGTSNIQKVPKDKLTRKLLMRAEIGHNVWSKAIVRVDKIVSCPSMHYFLTKNTHLEIDENYNQKLTIRENPTYNKIRINHYFCRDLDFLLNVKMPRLLHQGRPYYQNLIDDEKKCNQVYDDIILKLFFNK